MAETNVDFFRAFAEDTEYKAEQYYFEHDRPAMDFMQLFESQEDAETFLADDQIKLFHFTDRDGILKDYNESGGLQGVRYRGQMLALKKADIDEVIDTQKGVAQASGKYEGRVKALLNDETGILAQIMDYNRCSDAYDLTFPGESEVYNQFPDVMDGVWFKYDMYIRSSVTSSLNLVRAILLTQAEYDALAVKNPGTYYLING